MGWARHGRAMVKVHRDPPDTWDAVVKPHRGWREEDRGMVLARASHGTKRNPKEPCNRPGPPFVFSGEVGDVKVRAARAAEFSYPRRSVRFDPFRSFRSSPPTGAAPEATTPTPVQRWMGAGPLVRHVFGSATRPSRPGSDRRRLLFGNGWRAPRQVTLSSRRMPSPACPG